MEKLTPRLHYYDRPGMKSICGTATLETPRPFEPGERRLVCRVCAFYAQSMADWLREMERQLREGEAEDYSPSVTGAQVGDWCRYLMPGHSAHELRHRFATRAYRSSHDLLAVQQLLGHASVATTQRYAQLDPDRLAEVVGSIA